MLKRDASGGYAVSMSNLSAFVLRSDRKHRFANDPFNVSLSETPGGNSWKRSLKAHRQKNQVFFLSFSFNYFQGAEFKNVKYVFFVCVIFPPNLHVIYSMSLCKTVLDLIIILFGN